MNTFQKKTAAWMLTEASDHLKSLITKVESGEYDEDGEPAFFIGLQHIYEHLNLSWNYRHRPFENIGDGSQEEYEESLSCIPNLFQSFKLLESEQGGSPNPPPPSAPGDR